jgi:polyphosphate kinase
VRSIVGRYLEHSRIYWFGNMGIPDVYVGSADIMERNLDRRVETLFPINDAHIHTWIRRVLLETYLNDTARARVLQPDGSWIRSVPTHAPGLDCQRTFQQTVTLE